MSEENKKVVGRWFEGFWGNPWNPRIIEELATPDIVVHYPMHEPKKGRAAVTQFITEFREAFPDLNFWGVGDLVAEGDLVVGRAGKAAAPTPGLRSATSGSARCRRPPDAR
ncbi:ester cyclase [Bradyrhizobium sp. USDA 3256]